MLCNLKLNLLFVKKFKREVIILFYLKFCSNFLILPNLQPFVLLGQVWVYYANFVNDSIITAQTTYVIEMLSGLTHIRDETFCSFVNIFDYQVHCIQFIFNF